MNSKIVIKTLGRILRAAAALMLLPALVSYLYHESASMTAFLITAAIFLALGQGMAMVKAGESNIFAREGIVIVALSWVLLSLIGALPYVMAGVCGYINALFTIVSGLTTTGAAVLLEPELLPRGIIFWSCFSHWIGGMGVLVFVMAIIPLAGKNSMHLMRAEVPGPQVGKLVPKARKTALILYAIYFALTVVLTLLLLLGGMDFFDALLHAFSTAGTGGFSTYAASVGHFNSVYIDIVLTVFMLLFGVNFNLYYLILVKKARAAFRSEELKVYIIIACAAMLTIALNITSYCGGFFKALRYSSFQVASLMSTTGFLTADFSLWPAYSQAALIMMMIFGACAGSTAGGLKISRVMIMFKSMLREVRRMLHPRSVSVVRLEGRRVDEETVAATGTYFIIYGFIILASFLLISVDGLGFDTSITAVLSCVNNVGPGLGVINARGFTDFSWFSKIIFCLDMLFGRLEILPVITLFSPALWRKNG